MAFVRVLDIPSENEPASARIIGYNLPAAFVPGELLEDIPLSSTIVRNALITRREVINSIDGKRFDSTTQWYSRGAIYDGKGRVLPEFLAQAAEQPGKFDHPERIDRKRAAAATRVEGRCVYLGVLHGHFGHFLIESLARIWAALEQEPDTRFIFHYAGGDTPFPDFSRFTLSGFILTAFRALDLLDGRLILANTDLRVEELIVPNAQFRLHTIGSRGMCVGFDHLREAIRRQRPEFRCEHERLYLTRRRLLDSGVAAQTRKSVANEEELEALFSAHGFHVVSPEQHSFEEQVLMISGATHIAGTTGSALHMSLFNNRPDSKLISLDWRNSRTQYILDAARGIDSSHIYCLGGRNNDGLPVVDTDVVARALKHILNLAPDEPESGVDEAQGAKAARRAPKSAKADLNPQEYVASFRTAIATLTARETPPHQAMVLYCFLNEAQRQMGAVGNLLLRDHAVGATDLLALSFAKDEERVLLAGRTAADLAAAAPDLPGPIARRAQFSARLDNGAADVYRMAATRSASYAEAAADLAQCANRATPEGVIIAHNFFEPENPGVSAAALDFLKDNSGWDAIFTGFGVIVFAQRPMTDAYRNMFVEHARSFFRAFGAFAFKFDVELNGSLLCSGRGTAHKALAPAGAEP